MLYNSTANSMGAFRLFLTNGFITNGLLGRGGQSSAAGSPSPEPPVDLNNYLLDQNGNYVLDQNGNYIVL